MEFTKEQHETVSAAIREAEQHTRGQIICVLARCSSDYAHIPILGASVLALITPWPLIDFTQWSVQRIFLAPGVPDRRPDLLLDAGAAPAGSARGAAGARASRRA
jgi:uncharacterized membrane protein